MTTQTLDRETQLADEASEARWVDAQIAALAAEAGPPPF